MSVGMLPAAVLDLGLRCYLQEAVHDCESTLHNIVENTIDGLVIVDPEGYIVTWNPEQEQIATTAAGWSLAASPQVTSDCC